MGQFQLAGLLRSRLTCKKKADATALHIVSFFFLLPTSLLPTQSEQMRIIVIGCDGCIRAKRRLHLEDDEHYLVAFFPPRLVWLMSRERARARLANCVMRHGERARARAVVG